MTVPAPFAVSPKLTLVPIIHGSGDFAVAIRRLLLERPCDCLAVPLPPTFQSAVETAIEQLPAISVVVQREVPDFNTEWTPDADRQDDNDALPGASYVPIDPCQPVIAALRLAIQERIPRRFIDLETRHYLPVTSTFPDAYALKRVSLEQFAAAILPSLSAPATAQHADRIRAMGHRLRELERRHEAIVCLCSLTDWPWLREACRTASPDQPEDEVTEDPSIFSVAPATLLFALGELPFITGLYERARSELDDDENLSVDGIKELLQATRDRYARDKYHRARAITPQLLSLYLRYVRNLSLIERRMTPDLYTLVVAAQQLAGDQFAIRLAETAREYPSISAPPWQPVSFGLGQARFPDGTHLEMKSRLPGPPLVWRTIELRRLPDRKEAREWRMRWNPFGQCSWPPEDLSIERFRTHVKDRALGLIGSDLARSEKFTTSLMDGLDMRETLRNWHTGNLYVKVLPPTRGDLDCVIMLFDTPADPRNYPWRTTWIAEHQDESTLALFATNFHEEMVGPGIGLATYGGAVFLFPPRPVIDIWHDRALDFTNTLEERLIAGGCLNARERHVALLSPQPPNAEWRKIARRFSKKLVHVPLGHFSQATVQQLRLVHVLNGKQVRSYAADFIRKA